MKRRTADQMKAMPSTDPEYDNFHEEVCAYALNDAALCYELWEKFGKKWPQFERDLSEQTMSICYAGLPVDVEGLEKDREHLARIVWEAKKKIPWWRGEDNDVALSLPELHKACREAGIEAPKSTAKDSEECQEWEDKYAAQYPWVGAMRTVRRSGRLLSGTETILKRTHDGRFNFGLKYGGAHTLRWSGDSGFNVQNFSKEPYEGIDLRGRIKAEPGMKLVIMDLTQIEARVTPYLAGDERTVNLMRDGMNVYEVHARTSGMYDAATPLKTTDKKTYALAKARVLALGFGCGPDKFQSMARLPAYGSLELDLPFCKKTVKDFRDRNPKVVNLWNRLERGMYESMGDKFEVELPSGRNLSYRDVQMRPSKRKGKSDELSARVTINGPLYGWWGGPIFENAVQATARDLFANGLLNLEKAGYDILFHVHDELILHVPMDADVKEIERIFTTPPDGAPDFPLAAESQESQVYLK